MSRSFLGNELTRHGGRFQFFQAVRLLHRLFPERGHVGRFVPPHREVVRFSANNSLAFPPAEIHALQLPEDGPARMTVNFLGLSGPLAVLPYCYTELIRDRNRAKDPTLQEFFDLFHHRLVSLFYQAWEKYRFFVAYERDRQDRFSRYLMSFVGLGSVGLEKRQAVADESLLYYCGLLSPHSRSATALEQVLSDYFEIPVEVEQFVGCWYPLQEADMCSLEGREDPSDQIAFGVVAGDEVWDRQSRARLKLGPLTAEQYLSFLPDGSAWEPLLAITRFFSGDEIQFEVQLILKRGEVPACDISADGPAAPRLGWFSWIKSGPGFGRDPGDTLLMLS